MIEEEWDDIEFKAENASVIQERRKNAETKWHQKIEEEAARKRKEKQEQERRLVQEQIDVERAAREKVENLKKQERDMAQKSLQDWSNQTKKINHQDVSQCGSIQEILDNEMEQEEEEDDDIDIEAIRAKVKGELTKKGIIRPPPRTSTEIQVHFTSRGLIPTSTARESEDAKWEIKIKQMQDMHKRNTRSKAIKENEKDTEKNRLFFSSCNPF